MILLLKNALLPDDPSVLWWVHSGVSIREGRGDGRRSLLGSVQLILTSCIDFQVVLSNSKRLCMHFLIILQVSNQF